MYNIEIVTNTEYPLIGLAAHNANVWKLHTIKLNFHVHMPACLCSNESIMDVLGRVEQLIQEIINSWL